MSHCFFLFFSLYYLVAGLLMKKVIYQLYPLHDKKELKYLAKEWYQAVVKKQPIGGYGRAVCC